jgi:elongation factor 1-alpha
MEKTYLDYRLPEESDFGNTEYKLVINPERLEGLQTQMLFRLHEGNGQAFYWIGVMDNGVSVGITEEHFNLSIQNLSILANNLGAEVKLLRKINVGSDLTGLEDLLKKDYFAYILGYNKNIKEPMSKKKRRELKRLNAKINQSFENNHFENNHDTENTLKNNSGNGLFNLISTLWNGKTTQSKSENVSLNNDFHLPLTQTNVDRWIGYLELSYKVISQLTAQTITLGIAGNVDSGKSTLVGVLSLGELDNGRGRARLPILQHKHEITSGGQTSSISQEIIGFDKDGTIIDLSKVSTRENIAEQSYKIIKFLDLAGHEKYLKTTLKEISNSKPNYVIIMIEAGKGMTVMTKEHIKLCGIYKIPFIIIFSKIDIAPANKYIKNRKEVEDYLNKTYGLNIIEIDNQNEAQTISSSMIQFDSQMKTKSRNIPFINLSNITGDGLDILKTLLFNLPQNKKYDSSEETKFYIDRLYQNVKGSGLIISGILRTGSLEIGQEVSIGPDSNGEYFSTKIKSLRVDRLNVSTVNAGTHTTLSVKNPPKHITNEWVILGNNASKIALKEFKASIKIFNNKLSESSLTVTIRLGSQLVCSINNISKTVRVLGIISKNNQNICYNEDDIEQIEMENIYLRSGDIGVVSLSFDQPHYIEIGDMFSFREAYIYGVGKITSFDWHGF